jgi:hypothetical protein
VAEPPVTNSRLVFYLRDDSSTPSGANSISSLYGYDLQQDKRFLISATPTNKSGLAADEKTLVWIEDDTAIKAYDLGLARESLLLTLKESGSKVRGLAVEGDQVYYEYAKEIGGKLVTEGIFVLNLQTRQEKLIIPRGQGPVVRDNVLLWTARVSEHATAAYELHMVRTNCLCDERLLSVSKGHFTGYSVSGTAVVWASYPPEYNRRLYSYDLSVGSITQHRVDASEPKLLGRKVLMSTGSGIYPVRGSRGGSIVLYDLDKRDFSVIHASDTILPRPVGIASKELAIYILYDERGLFSMHAATLVSGAP